MESQHLGVERRTLWTADGVALPVVHAGAHGAPTLVLVHGVASSWRSWEPLLAQPQLLERYHLVAFDLRGHGEHPMPLTPSQLQNKPDLSRTGEDPTDDDDRVKLFAGGNTEPWVQDLDAVMKGLDARDTVHLVGWSFGSTVVQDWMRSHAGLHRAASATLVAGPSVLGVSDCDGAVTDLVSEEAFNALAGAVNGGESAYAELILARSDDDHRVDARTRAVAEEDARRASPAAVAAALTYSFDHRAFLLALPVEQRARINALVCEQDQVFHAPSLGSLWAQAGVRTHLLAAQPHALPLVDPDRLARELLTLLSPLDPSGDPRETSR